MKNSAPRLLDVSITGDGPTILLIHGVAGSQVIWDSLRHRLEGRFRVISLDLLGYGHSPKPHIDYTPQAHLEAIELTLDHHRVSGQYLVAGLSMGSLLAIELASRRPNAVIGVVAIGLPYFKDPAQAVERLCGSFWARVILKWGLFGEALLRTTWWLSLHNTALLRRVKPKIYNLKIARESLLSPYYVLKSTLLNCMVHNDIAPKLAALREIPLLVIQGSDDEWSNETEVRTLLEPQSKANVVVAPESGHNVAVLSPDFVAEQIITFAQTK